MTGARKRQLQKRFCRHIHPVKTFRGDPTRPAYTLYSWWEYATYLAGMNELDELLEQWPYNRARTVALLSVQQAFYDNGAPHWAEEQVRAEDRENIHAHMLEWRRMMRRIEPGRAARYAEHQALAEAALAESQRRKQGPKAGKGLHQLPQTPQHPKALQFTPAQARPNNRPAARPRYTAAQLQRDPLAYEASKNELDDLLDHWPYKQNRIVYLLAVHEALAQRGGRVADEAQLLDPGNPAHHVDRARRLQRAAARAADPGRADRHKQAEREALSCLKCRKLYPENYPKLKL